MGTLILNEFAQIQEGRVGGWDAGFTLFAGCVDLYEDAEGAICVIGFASALVELACFLLAVDGLDGIEIRYVAGELFAFVGPGIVNTAS